MDTKGTYLNPWEGMDALSSIPQEELMKKVETLRIEQIHSSPKGQENQDADPLRQLTEDALTAKDLRDLEEQKVIYPNLIPKSQTTVLCGAPGSGKTTLCIREAAPKLADNGFQVLYIDADSPPDFIRRVMPDLERHNIKLIAPHIKGRSPDYIIRLLKEIVERGTRLDGCIFFIDTLKKVADLFNKSSLREFFKLCRALTGLGATLVLLAHTNKHTNNDGRPVFEGMGDVINDTDNLLYLVPEKVDSNTIKVTVITDPAQGAKVRANLKNWSFCIKRDTLEVSIEGVVDNFVPRDPKTERVLWLASHFLQEADRTLTFTELCDSVLKGQDDLEVLESLEEEDGSSLMALIHESMHISRRRLKTILNYNIRPYSQPKDTLLFHKRWKGNSRLIYIDPRWHGERVPIWTRVERNGAWEVAMYEARWRLNIKDEYMKRMLNETEEGLQGKEDSFLP